jgi:flavodoxin
MNSLVVYGSPHGNTHKLADAIAFELGKHGVVQLVSAEDARKVLPEQLDGVKGARLAFPMSRGLGAAAAI